MGGPHPGVWRVEAARAIEAVLERFEDWDSPECRWALREAYPFGERKYWPYKVWLDEIRCQTGRRTWGVARKPRRRRGDPRHDPRLDTTPELPFEENAP